MAHHERGGLLVQRVALALRAREVDLAPDGIEDGRLRAEDIGPGRREGILDVGHEDARAAVQGVDEHLRLGRPGDLDAPVDEVGGRLRDAPLALPKGGRLGQVVERRSGGQGGPPLPTPLQELEPAWPERSLQAGHKAQRVRCEDALRVRRDGRRDLHAIRKRQCHPTTATRPRGVVHVSSRLDRVTAPSPVTIRRASAASSRSGRSSPNPARASPSRRSRHPAEGSPRHHTIGRPPPASGMPQARQ